MSSGDKRIAVLIDADNAPAAKIDVILAEVARHGSANVRRAYGDWKSPNLQRWQAVLDRCGIDAVQQVAYTKGKNATDIAMVVGAMDLLHDKSIDAFAIVSSDADFTPLVRRLQCAGHTVHGFGEEKAPKPFRDSCTTFTILEPQVKVPPKVTKPAKTSAALAKPKTPPRDEQKLRADTHLHQRLRNAVEATKAENGWADLAKVGKKIRETAVFDQRKYGYRQLGDLMAATERFEVRLGRARYKHAA
jgi:uncharacterized protein (TIGR00288 family)